MKSEQFNLMNKVASVKSETKEALQHVFSQLNNGQQKKMLKNEAVKALFDRYSVEYSK